MNQRYVTAEAKKELLETHDLFYLGVADMAADLRHKYAALVWDTGPSDVALVASNVVAYGMEWGSAIVATQMAGHNHCADAMLRVQLENTANLLYILFAGPKIDGRSQEDLASQYLAFGEHYHVKLIKKSGSEMRKRIKETGLGAGKPYTVEEFDEMAALAKARLDEATTRFAPFLRVDRNGKPTFGSRWTTFDMEQMLGRVVLALPTWLDDKPLLNLLRQSVTNWNSTLHASAFNFVRDRARINKETLLRFPESGKTHAGHMAGMFAYYNWMALAELLGDVDEVKNHTNAKWNDRFDPIAKKHLQPKMTRVD